MKKKSVNPYQTRASSIPIDGPYKEFAQAIRGLLGWENTNDVFHSTRAARFKTGLSNATISKMTNGWPVKNGTVITFAHGLNVEPEPLIRLLAIDKRSGDSSVEPNRRNRADHWLPPNDPLLDIGDDLGMAHFESVPLSREMASAGESIPAPGEGDSPNITSIMPGGVRAIRVRGDCMEPWYHEGDILLVRPAHHAETGQVVVARVGNEIASVKVYRHTDEGQYLETAAEPRVRITDDFEILGVVEGFTRLHGRIGNGWQ